MDRLRGTIPSWVRAGRPASGVPVAALLLGLALLPSGPAASGQAFSVPPGFGVVPVAGGFTLPVAITFTPDGTLLVAEKPGVVRVVDAAGQLQPAPLLDLVDEINNDHDRGLLGCALHPGFVADGGATSWVYLLYSVSPVPPSDNGFNQDDKYGFGRLTRYRVVTSGGALVADLSSRQILLGHQLPDGSVPDGLPTIHGSHGTDSLRFADDGSLLLSLGDAAHYDLNDTGGFDDAAFDDFVHPVTGQKGPVPKAQDIGVFRAQDLDSLSGKILRIDPETGLGYPSNPFYAGDPAALRARVWALGLRNPYRFDLVPGTGSANPAAGQPNVMLIADVGWNTYEELNVSRFGGENFGWPCFEGPFATAPYDSWDPGNPAVISCFTTPPGTPTMPRLAWEHHTPGDLFPAGLHEDAGGNPGPGFTGNSAIGGPVYTGGTYPASYIGRAFVADYGHDWVRTLEFDASWNVVAAHDFGSDMGTPVDLERHPITGDIYIVSLSTESILRVTFGESQAPVAVATGAPTSGPAPLAVQLTGSASHDPDGGALAFDWDFGDGTAHGTEADPSHTYASNGEYTARLVVTDPSSLSDDDVVVVSVGNLPPLATILSPAQGTLYDVPVTIPLSGAGTDPEGQPLAYDWQVDMYHSTHVHPGAVLASGQQASFEIADSDEMDELVYYRVELTVTDAGGLQDTAHAFVYPRHSYTDIAGTATPISRVFELSPPEPLGGGNKDVEVIRDNVFAPFNSSDDAAQFDHFHFGNQGNDDWIGYELAAPPDESLRFVAIDWEEGKSFIDGGWFADLRVEVRQDGQWITIAPVTIAPAYPLQFSNQPWFDGLNFNRYALAFDPVPGDAIRLRGTPGGSFRFISTGELRVMTLQPTPHSPYADLSPQGSIIARLDGLSPPEPLGSGNHDRETIRNGTLPPAGSASQMAQFDTFHNGEQAGDDWIGYDFGGLATFNRVLFQEGLNGPDGGAFDTLHVQVQSLENGPWTDVPGLTVTPPYDGLDGESYETFTLDFPPVNARAIRIQGPPSGSGAYVSVGELAVFGPAVGDGCGWVTYGANAGGANTLTLASTTPPGLGLPVVIHGSGAQPFSSGFFGIALAPGSYPVKGGTFLLSAASPMLLPVSFDAGGALNVGGLLPGEPALAGVSVYLQVFAFGQPQPHPFRLSNGLQMTFCSW